MQILELHKLPKDDFDKTVVTIGNFDGVHAGHQELIKKVVAEANNNNYRSIVITFSPHPAEFFQPLNAPPSIISKSFKEKLISSLEVDAILTLTFDEWLAGLTPIEYVKEILLNKLNTKIIWIGYDFTFGRNRTGNARLLVELSEKFGFRANVLTPMRIQDIVVSSSKIRELILNGQVDFAAQLMNRYHTIKGTVVGGDKKGRILGFPTVNIDVKEGLIPMSGIYFGISSINDVEYPAAVYIGKRPTYSGKELRVEAHIIGFDGDLYNQELTVAFIRFQRDDVKFDNNQLLAKKINEDIKTTNIFYWEFKHQPKKYNII